MSSAVQHAYHYTKRLGFGLVPIPVGQKRPITKGWQENPITDPEQARRIWQSGQNMGLLHSVSNTCVIDVDHAEWLKLAAAVLDFDLLALIEAAPVKIQGKNGAKPLFRIPDGLSLTLHKLNWPHPTEVVKNGKPRQVTIIEFRAGHGKQDVLPPSIHPDTGKPYVWVGTPPRCLEDIPYLPDVLVTFWENLSEHVATMRAACPWGKVDTAPTPTPYSGPRNVGGPSVIDPFRQASGAVERELEAEGYLRAGTDRYLSPHSSTKAAAVVVFTDDKGIRRARSYHGSDDWSDEHGHDAFDLFCRFRHGGDVRAAVKAAAEQMGMTRPTPAPDASTFALSLEDAKANWATHGDELIGKMLEALSHTNMHHHARTALGDLLANIYYRASEGELQLIGGHLCAMVGGMNQLAAELGGRPNDASARLKLAASHGFLGKVVHSDPADPRSSLLISLPADPFRLPFLQFTREELHSLILRPTTRETRRPVRKLFTPPVDTHCKATPTGGVNRKSPKNPLQDAWRVALTLSRTPGLSLKEVGRLARCRQDTLRRHLATLEAAGLAKGTRLLVTFREVFAAMHAAVKDRTEQRMAAFMRHAQQYARWELGLARLGSAAARRVAPARRRLLKRAESYLGVTPPQGSYAHTLRMSA